MKALTMEEIKAIEYDILSEVASFCDSHGIQYYLVCGTLLGAIRHNGFIPWDDDIDIGMPRPDYERFIREYTSPSLTLHDFRRDPVYPYPFAKVSDPRTCLIETNLETPAAMGVYIDIFPIDGMPENEKEQKRFFNLLNWDRRLLGWKRISNTAEVGFTHKVVQVIAKILLKPTAMSQLIARYDRHVKQYPYDTASHVGHFVTAAAWGSDIKPKSLFENAVKHPFEQGEFWVPGDYDQYLTIEYGDYMKLPPKEKQIAIHGFTVGWREE